MTSGEKVALGIGGLAGAGLLAYVGYRLITSGPPTIEGRSFASWVIECGGLMKTQGYTYSVHTDAGKNLPCVRVINYLLAQVGYNRAPYNVNPRSAQYTESTASAVAALQSANGLKATGVMDYPTYQVLLQAYAGATGQRPA
jgi:hypothetical protein